MEGCLPVPPPATPARYQAWGSTSCNPSWAWPQRRMAVATGSLRRTAASSPTAERPSRGRWGGQLLTAPIAGIASPGGQGYWLVAADAGVFAFGGAPFYGSAASIVLSAPVSGITATPDGRGYRIVAQDGGVFSYGSAPFDPQVGPMFGTPVGVPTVNPVIALLPGSGRGNYSLVAAFPAVDPAVAGRNGFDLARREFALGPNSLGGYAVAFDLGQTTEYLQIDGSVNGAGADEVATCLDELDQLDSYIEDTMAYGRPGSVPYAIAVASAVRTAEFFQLPSDPYLSYRHPVPVLPAPGLSHTPRRPPPAGHRELPEWAKTGIRPAPAQPLEPRARRASATRWRNGRRVDG